MVQNCTENKYGQGYVSPQTARDADHGSNKLSVVLITSMMLTLTLEQGTNAVHLSVNFSVLVTEYSNICE